MSTDVWNALRVAFLREEPGDALGERLAADALEDGESRRPGRVGDRERREVGADLGLLQAAEDTVLERKGDQHVAHAGDEVLVDRRRGCGRAVGEHGVEVLVERDALLRRQAALERRVPVDADPGLERLGVELARRVEHQVVLQALVGELEVVAVGRTQALLEATHDARHQRVIEQVLIAEVGGSVELSALVEAERHRERRLVETETGRLRCAAHGGEHRRQRRHVARGRRRQAVDGLLQLRHLGLDLGDVALVARVAEQPAADERDAREQDRGEAERAHPAAPPLHRPVLADQALLLEDDVLQQAIEEEALAARGGRRGEPALDAEGARQRAHHAVDRRAFLRAAGEVHAAQQRPLLDRRRRR